MTTVMEAIRQRRSIRRFKPEPIPSEILAELIEAARLAPSGSNRQPARFRVVTDEEGKKKLAEASFGQQHLAQAGAVFICCADMNAYSQLSGRQRRDEMIAAGVYAPDSARGPVDGWEDPKDIDAYLPQAWLNVGIAVEHVVLAATALGLGTCWVQMFSRKKVGEAFGIGRETPIIALLAVGYPDQDPAPRPRHPVEKILLAPLP